MITTLAFAPTEEDLEEYFFAPPVLTFAPPPPPDPIPPQTPVAGTPER
ncbi:MULTISPECIES: hypothetical protein [Gemmobacter]|jgi:hypothetical protein|uniref:Uncharacterized protein n=1 Tax=Gemmobacter nanjingensis TaxID=488454 RepID=A0ABQ3F6Y1_9RHOB|nr:MULTISPECIES: hypothetical protein [Gemmobacter]GHC10585.1 hypothetical protein GCM10007291_03890 [Gemmobacter nanjingensis]